jgi:spermidine synthase
LAFFRLTYLRAVFFLSGFCALAYQVCWSKILSQVIGTDTLSWVASICVFLVGLAAGATIGEKWLQSGLSDSRRGFFILEIGLGGFGLFSDSLIRGVAGWSSQFGGEVFAVWGYVFDFLAQAFVLAPATMAMGAALPLLLVSYRRECSTLQSTGVYALTSFGGAFGAFLTGVVLVGVWGIQDTLRAIALLQGVVALTSIVLLERGILGEQPRPAFSAKPSFRFGRLHGICFVLGFVALSLEILYFRVLTYFLSGTGYVTPIALSGYLFLVGCGYWLSSKAPQPTKAHQINTWVFGTLSALGILFIAPYVYFWLDVPYYKMMLAAGASWPRFGISFCLATVLMLPVLFLSGIFPRIVALSTQSDPDSKYRIGSFLTFQALGNLLGAVVTSAVLIPAVGTVWAFRINVCLMVIVATILLSPNWRASSLHSIRQLLSVAVFGGGAFLIASPDFVTLFRDPIWRRPSAIWENQAGTVFVYEPGCRPTRVARLGSEDVADIPKADNLRTVYPLDLVQAWRGARPPEKILIIGLGRGDQAVLLKKVFPQARVEVVELLPAMVEELGLSGSPLALEIGPQLEFHFGDGRRFLNRMRNKLKGDFDIIQMGVLNASVSGAGNLFTLEAIKAAKELLAPDGVLLFPAYPPAVQAALRVFPSSIVASEGVRRSAHALFSNLPEPDLKTLQSNYRLASGQFSEALKLTGVELTAPLHSHIYIDKSVIEKIVESISVQQDDLTVTEYFLTQRSTLGSSLPDTVLASTYWKQEATAVSLSDSFEKTQ